MLNLVSFFCVNNKSKSIIYNKLWFKKIKGFFAKEKSYLIKGENLYEKSI